MGFICLGSKITVNGDCSHEIKIHLLLGRKSMTNLGGILKSRDITLPTNVQIVKTMVSPVVMYRYDSWTISKAESQKNWCLQSVEINPEYSLEGLMLILKLQYFVSLMWRTDSLENTLMMKDWRQEGKGTTENEMVGWHHWLNGYEFEQGLGDGEEQGALACCSPWDHKDLFWVTEQYLCQVYIVICIMMPSILGFFPWMLICWELYYICFSLWGHWIHLAM